MSRVLRDSSAPLTEQEHNDLALHFYAVEWHIRAMLDIFAHRARVKWIDRLIRSLNGRFGNGLRSALDDDWHFVGRSPYYGNHPANDPAGKVCPMPKVP